MHRRGANAATEVRVAGKNVEVLRPEESVSYLGRCLCFLDFADRELEHRVNRGWAKFATFKNELCDRRYSLLHRLRLFNAVVAPSVLYGAGCWTMTSSTGQRLRVTQRKMLRKMVGTGRRRRAETAPRDQGGAGTGGPGQEIAEASDSSSASTTSSDSASGKGTHEETDEDDKQDEETWVEWVVRTTQVASDAMRKAKIPDWVQEQRRRKWRWAGHVMRRTDMRWSYRFLGWCPVKRGSRSVGRPAMRWEDCILKFLNARGVKWGELAKDRDAWRAREDEFVKFEA